MDEPDLGIVTPRPTVEFRTSSLAPASDGGASPAGPELRHEFATVTGGELEYWCDGEGPTVVFLSAFGGDDSLAPTARQLADEAYVCFYFRPGDFYSRPLQGFDQERPRPAGGVGDFVDPH